MHFGVSRVSRSFWHHFTHLRVIHEDEYGLKVRRLSPTTCVGCKALWEALTPVTGPLWTDRERFRPLSRQVFIRDDGGSDGGAKLAELPRHRDVGAIRRNVTWLDSRGELHRNIP